MTFVSTDSANAETTTWLTPLSLVNELGTFDLDPCGYPDHKTANELFKKTKGTSQVSQANIQPRLNELVSLQVAQEVGIRNCEVTGNRVLVYDVTRYLPWRAEKPKKIKCKACDGKGHIISDQTSFLIRN